MRSTALMGDCAAPARHPTTRLCNGSARVWSPPPHTPCGTSWCNANAWAFARWGRPSRTTACRRRCGPRWARFTFPDRRRAPPLHREVAADVVLGDVGDRAGDDDLAAHHDGELVGEVAGELAVLLDQQDRHVAPLA